MAGQCQKLVNKQYNSPIQLYSDRSVREIIQKESRVLSNGAIGIDFNNPMTDKPANLQNSAVLRMLEEEENRKRSGQPGCLKRVAWPPPSEELEGFIEQEAVHSQGGPLYSSKSESNSSQYNQAPIQQTPTSPAIQQQQQQPHSPLITKTNINTFQPIISPPSATPSQSATKSPHYQSAPLSPNITATSTSPVSFINLAKPWSPQGASTPQFKPVQPPSLRTIQSYQSSEQYQYRSQDQIRETQTVLLPTYQQTTSAQETSFQQYQTPPVVETQRTYETIKTQREQQFVPRPNFPDLSETSSTERVVEISQPVTKSPSFESSATIQIQQESPNPQPKLVQEPPPKAVPEIPKPVQQPTKIIQPKPVINPTLTKTISTEQIATPPIKSQTSVAAQGIAQNRPSQQPRYQPAPPKQVEPPPSTITLRPQAPVSQAPPPLVTSQPATATLRGGKHLRGDLKWPPEDVREKMAAEQQHLLELAKGPACRPRKQCKDYSGFFAKHALNHAYPGYKIPPGTQYYEHNPVM